MRIGIDMDGVLANFTDAYAELLEQESGVEFPRSSGTWPDVWDFAKRPGVTAKHRDRVWQHIKSGEFWGQLLPLPGALEAIQRLNALRWQGYDIYFITARPGDRSKLLTEQWLLWHGANLPTVVMSNDKGPGVRALKLDVFVDDRPENIFAAIDWWPTVRAYLIDRPYNRNVEPSRRAASLNEVLDSEFPVVRERRVA